MLVFFKFDTTVNLSISASPWKSVNGNVSQLPIIPPPIFYDKAKIDASKGTLEVRILLRVIEYR